MLKSKATYLLPIWFDIEDTDPDATMYEVNEGLKEALEEIAKNATIDGGQLDVSWSITERVNIEGAKRGLRGIM